MATLTINWWALLALLVGSTVLGYAWYSKALFGNAWMRGVHKTEEELKGKQGPAMVGMLVLSVIMLVILGNIVHWANAATFGEGLLVGLLVWLGFSFALGVTNGLFAQRSMTAVWIEQLYYLVVLVVSGGVFAAWV